ncbi:MAG: SPFH domain-containing protein [Planctomycetes bacterium]|nr:SPFH domain-containing protein [Planctomycetota bacterium]
MGLIDFIKGQFIDIVEWLDDSNHTLVWRFPRYENSIKMGAQLVVREGQAAAFVNMGRLADVYQPGMYTLSTQNMPILSDIMGWKYGFESPFKAEVYFVNTRQYLDQKWGTSNPIMMRDPEFGPVRVRAYGLYAFRVTDPGTFLRQVVGTDGSFTVEKIEGLLKQTLVSSFTKAIATAKIPVLDMAGSQEEVAKKVWEVMQPAFTDLGVGLPRFVIENISLPPEVEKLLDQRTGVGIMGGHMGAFSQLQAGQAMREAATNPSGTAGAGVGLGAGFAMANMMAQSMVPAAAPAAVTATPAAAPAAAGARPCTGCGKPLAAGAKFCPECGARQSAVCPSCANPLAPGAKFCGNCGARLA